MRILFILSLTILFSNVALAQSATTKQGYAACQTEAWLDDFMTFANADDTNNMNAYLQAQRCISLRAGLTVTITDRSGMLGSKVAFVYEGVKLWTVREALDRS